MKNVETFKDDNGDVISVCLKIGQSKSNEVCTTLEQPVTLINWEHFKIIKLSWGDPCVAAPL